MFLLLNPKTYTPKWSDQKTNEIMTKTIAFFEKEGLANIKKDDENMSGNEDFIRFLKDNKILSTMLTPFGYGQPDSRFDFSRVCRLSEILGFYGTSYMYTYHVSILGLSSIWMGENEALKHKAAKLLQEGAVFGFGLSEKNHGADLYSNEMKVVPLADGTYEANGSKYCIGNADKAALISVHGRFADNDEHVLFAVNTQHHHYKLVKRINTSGIRNGYAGEFELVDYPITKKDFISSGHHAWNSFFSCINIGKVQHAFCSIGLCTHSLYEAMNHAANRIVYGKPVTQFAHIKKKFTESYVRLNAMKLYALRSLDYFRSISKEDRRYLLFNSIQKAKVPIEGVRVMELILDIVVARGFEKETFMELAVREIGMLPRLEGTVHVNSLLVIKFLKNYFFNHREYPFIPKRDDSCDDASIFQQFTGDFSKVQFPDYRLVYEGIGLPNVTIFKSQVELFREMISDALPNPIQKASREYLFSLCEMFTLIVYAQLILESCKNYEVGEDLIDQIFNFLIRDFSHYALSQMTDTANTDIQEEYLRKMIKMPCNDKAREVRLWREHVETLNGAYAMNS